MKTLKKLLSAVLILALAAGLAGPASAIRRQLSFFPDADLFDEDYRQAAEVMVYHGVIEGDEGGLRPLDTISRAEACKIVTFMLEGPEAGAMEGVIAHTWYTDVPSDEWYTSYVEYCTEAGIVSGDNGDGTGPFRPDDEITGYEFGKMCLCAIGYDSVYEGFETDAWQYQISRLAWEAGTSWELKDFAWDAPITRQEAFQMAVSAMERDQVIKLYDEAGLCIGYDEDTLESILWLEYNTEHIVSNIMDDGSGNLIIGSEYDHDIYTLPEYEREYFGWVVSAYVENVPDDIYVITLRHLHNGPWGHEEEGDDYNGPDPALLDAGLTVYVEAGLRVIVYNEFKDDNINTQILLYIENNNDYGLNLESQSFFLEDDLPLSDYMSVYVPPQDHVEYVMLVYMEDLLGTGYAPPYHVQLVVNLSDPNDSSRVWPDAKMDILVDPSLFEEVSFG